MNKRDEIIHRHFSKMAHKSVESRRASMGAEGLKAQMIELSRRAVEARQRNRQIRALVVDLDTPENNCKICGASHKEINDNNKVTYAKVHQKYLVKLVKKP